MKNMYVFALFILLSCDIVIGQDNKGKNKNAFSQVVDEQGELITFCALVNSYTLSTSSGPSPNCTYKFAPNLYLLGAQLMQFKFTNGGVTQYVCYTSSDGVSIQTNVQSSPCVASGIGLPFGTSVQLPEASFILPCGNSSSAMSYDVYNGSNLCNSGVLTSALPIKLIAFYAYTEHDYIKLEWQTATETNSGVFIIQRSTNAIDFEDIAKQDAKGFSNETIDYQYIDNIRASGTMYYRLKEIDIDGKINFSKIVSVNTEKQLPIKQVYPNPVYHNKLSIISDDDLLDVWIVNTSNGFSIKGMLEKENYANERVYSFTFREKPIAGIYLIYLKTADSIDTQKIIIE